MHLSYSRLLDNTQVKWLVGVYEELNLKFPQKELLKKKELEHVIINITTEKLFRIKSEEHLR